MLEPILCKSCGGCVGNRFPEFYSALRSGAAFEAALDALDIDYCCRITIKTYPREMDEMCVQLSTEVPSDSGCEIMQTQRNGHNMMRVQRAP